MAETALKTKLKAVGKPDTYIIGIYITLLLVSIVESYSASSREIVGSALGPMFKQLAFLALGVVIMVICARMNYTRYLRGGILFSVMTFALMVYAAVFGKTINGANRAVHVLGMTLQPAEFAKLSIVFVLSLVMASNIDRKLGRIKNAGLVISLIIVAAFSVLLVKQGMTNTLLFICISASLLIIGKINYKPFCLALMGFALIIVSVYAIQSKIEASSLDDLDKTEQVVDDSKGQLRDKTWKARIDRYLQRWKTPMYLEPITGENDQEMYAYMAQANGGITGVMPGNSRECSRLPLAFSDYVFSIVVEDLGFLGGVFLIGLFFTLLIRAGGIARRCSRAFPAFLVMGAAVMVVLQAFFHIAINTGVFPVSGQQLPLISKGGTSVIVTSIAFGVMLSVSRTATQSDKAKDARREDEALPERMRVANPTKDK